MVFSKKMQIYQELVENSLDAQYVLNRETMEFVLVNEAFEELTGYKNEEVLHGKLKPLDIVHREDWDVVQKLDSPEGKIVSYKFEFRLIQKDGTLRRVENCIRNIKFHGHSHRIGSMRDITNRSRFEKHLKHEIHSEKEKTQAVAKANVRIYQLNERIQRVPQLTAKLLNVSEEQDLMQEAAQMMCDRWGLNYKAVTFLIKSEDCLEVQHSTLPLTKLKYNIKKSSRYARIFRGKTPMDPGSSDEYILPIQSKEKDIGLMHVYFHLDEKLLFDEQESIRNGQKDILRTIGNILGLMIDNLRLMRTIKKQSIMDQLTQTYNRRYFNQKSAEEFRRAVRYKRHLSMIVIDVDKFKYYNDTYGHLQGDLVLQQVSALFKENLREQDILCRYGGDEFVLLLPETDQEGAYRKGEHLRSIVESYPFPNLQKKGKPLTLSLSVGVATLNSKVASEEELFRCADEALYKAKRGGRNLVCCYNGN